MRFPIALVASLALLSGRGAAADKPNVIFIMADDQGSVDLGCYGAKDLHTPHTDALAARGMRFTQFYSAAPVRDQLPASSEDRPCSPSRAGALTGRWPVRAGVPGNCASQKDAKGALPAEEVTMAEMFKAAGLRHRTHRQVAPRLHAGNLATGAGIRPQLRPHGRLH